MLKDTDVVIVGTGAAGLFCALHFPENVKITMVTKEVADNALKMLEIDHLGLDATDKKMLTSIMLNFGGGPVGLETLAATIGEDSSAIEDMYEPYLLQLGFIQRTPRGRCVTKPAYEHYNIAVEEQSGTQIKWE